MHIYSISIQKADGGPCYSKGLNYLCPFYYRDTLTLLPYLPSFPSFPWSSSSPCFSWQWALERSNKHRSRLQHIGIHARTLLSFLSVFFFHYFLASVLPTHLLYRNSDCLSCSSIFFRLRYCCTCHVSLYFILFLILFPLQDHPVSQSVQVCSSFVSSLVLLGLLPVSSRLSRRYTMGARRLMVVHIHLDIHSVAVGCFPSYKALLFRKELGLFYFCLFVSVPVL